MLINPLNDWNFLVVFSEKDFDESVLLRHQTIQFMQSKPLTETAE